MKPKNKVRIHLDVPPAFRDKVEHLMHDTGNPTLVSTFVRGMTLYETVTEAIRNGAHLQLEKDGKVTELKLL